MNLNEHKMSVDNAEKTEQKFKYNENMIKKIIGYFLYAICILCSIAIFSALPKLLIEILKIYSTNFDAYQIGIVIGLSVGLTLISTIVYYIWRFSEKLVKVEI